MVPLTLYIALRLCCGDFRKYINIEVKSAERLQFIIQFHCIESAVRVEKMSAEKSKLVLCVGICCLDIIHVCEDYPVEDSDRRSKHGRWQRGGNPANNCTVLALLDQPCEYLGAYSTDPMFQPVLEDFKHRGIRIDHCVAEDNVEIPLSSVLLSLSTGTRTIVHSNPNLRELTLDDFLKCHLRDYQWIHFEPRTPDVQLMMKHVQQWNANVQQDRRITVSLELEKPTKHPLEYAELCDVLFISQDYAEQTLKAGDMLTAVTSARGLLQNKK